MSRSRSNIADVTRQPIWFSSSAAGGKLDMIAECKCLLGVGTEVAKALRSDLPLALRARYSRMLVLLIVRDNQPLPRGGFCGQRYRAGDG
jgi:hypothetical protein